MTNSDVVRLTTEFARISKIYSVLFYHCWLGTGLTVLSLLHLWVSLASFTYKLTYITKSFDDGVYAIITHLNTFTTFIPKKHEDIESKDLKNVKNVQSSQAHVLHMCTSPQRSFWNSICRTSWLGNSIFKYQPLAYMATNSMLLQKRMTH